MGKRVEDLKKELKNIHKSVEVLFEYAKENSSISNIYSFESYLTKLISIKTSTNSIKSQLGIDEEDE